MASPELELQGACIQALKADSALTTLTQGRVYDQPPTNAATGVVTATYPYVTIGEAQFIRDDATCVNGGGTYLTIHAWSTKPGFPEVKKIADAMVETLHLAPLILPTNRLISIMHRNTRTFRDADGLTSHAVIEFVANTEKP